MERKAFSATQSQGHSPRHRQWQVGLFAALLLLLPFMHTSAQQTDNPFGIVEGFWFPELTCDLGVGWERIIFDWSQHQPNSPMDWHTLNVDDRWLKAANQCNREVVAILKNSPAWATSGTPGSGVPNGLYLPVDDPNNHWANFVRQSARYYASRGVHRFIIWNEPDIARDTYGFEFEGDLDDYFQMLKVSYLAAKQGNPAAQVHLAGTTYWHDINEGRRIYLDRLLERIAQDEDAAANDYYFDAVSLHIYFRSDSVYDIITEVRALLNSYDMGDKAIWVNETNAPPTQDPEWPVERPVFQYTLEQQASFLIHAAALAQAAGAERMAVYKLYDQELPPGGETFGILRPNDQSQRPAFHAWQTVNTLFTDITSAERTLTDTAEAVILHREDGSQVVALWARTDQETELLVSGASGSLYSQLDASQPLETFTDEIRVTLPPARCNGEDENIPCPVGGEAFILETADVPLTIQEVSSDGTMVALLTDGEVVTHE